MKIGILTGGGDCPGLNSVIRGVVRKAILDGHEVLGLRYGWKGLLDKDTVNLDLRSVSGILPKGGTILGTSRTNPYKKENGVNTAKENFKSLGLGALVAIGGEDTLGVAAKLSQDGLKIVGVPKTIDNDLEGTDFTFGFDTAVNIVMECIDRLHTTAESHNRIMVVEVMGRHAGWIAAYSGIAGGADYILIPEIPIDIEKVCSSLRKRHERGKNFSIVVVAEGAFFKEENVCLQEKKLDEFGHVRLGGIGHTLGRLIEEKTSFETRVTVLGHIQRGGSPTAFDRVLGTRFGVKAYDLIKEGKFGRMASLKGKEVIDVSLEEATAKLKTLDLDLYELASIFF
ncbi:MAG: 6-phosphofructokinase [Candidatus Omnitrophica bacterium]|nr:6-phosphofructokinase [Candidatus Omnitrophota bacterium]MBU2044465.1 6-phosphofructokinase [Candidatus Omnitrophota bacterium]MBU2265946.1 6-phosphofructokinase [Candidatus Omnitrophota bacterium]MBU2474095.1 6-phosphofructokinase [Candidatus Omnitrophota bacterium]